jgi:hypothetical protein
MSRATTILFGLPGVAVDRVERVTGEATGELLAAWIAKEELRYLLSLARTHAQRSEISNRLYAFYDWCARADVPEVTRLARTIEAWWPQVLAFTDTGITNARTEATNRMVKDAARIAFGFRNLETSAAECGCTASGRSSASRCEDDQPLNFEQSVGSAPLTTDSIGARLPDVDPRCDVDLLKVELEQRIARRGLDHPADAASRHDTADERRGVDVGGDVCRGRPDAEFVVLGAGHGMDHTAGISPQVMSLRRRVRDGGEQTAACDDRAERMKARGAVWPHRGQVGDGERRCAGGDGVAAGQSDDARP